MRPLKFLGWIPEFAVKLDGALLHLHVGPGRVAVEALPVRALDIDLVLRPVSDARRTILVGGDRDVEAAVLVLANAEFLPVPAVEVAEEADGQGTGRPLLEGDVAVRQSVQAKLLVGSGNVE